MPCMELQRWKELDRVGHTHRDLQHLLDAGTIERVRHGVYSPPVELDALDAHRRLVQATWRVLRAPAVVSHYSAAVLHGLPVPANGLQKVWLTRGATHGKSSPWIHLCRGDLGATEVAEADGLAVTTPARTAVDLARRMSFVDGVTLVDAVLARQDVAATTLSEILDREPRRRGTVRAREVLEFADGRSESPGESRSRVVLWQHGVPAPELQVPVYDRDGLIGRVDFLWREQRVIGEFDGRIKYSSDLAPGGDPAEVVWREKLREDRLRRAGWIVVRWVWADLSTPYALARRILVALGS